MRAKANPFPAVHAGQQREPARERIWDAILTTLPVIGVRSPTIDQLAYVAETNSKTVLKYFGSISEIIIAYLEYAAEQEEMFWRELDEEFPKEPEVQVREWVDDVRSRSTGEYSVPCPITRAATELSSTNHDARALIRKFRLRQREHLAGRCRAAGFRDPEALGDKLFMLAEGARSGMDSIGKNGPALKLVEAAEQLMAAHR